MAEQFEKKPLPTSTLNSTVVSVSELNDTEVGAKAEQVVPTPKYSKWQLRMILGLVAVAGVMAPMASAIYFPALLNIQHDLNTSDFMVDLTVSCFLALMAIAPLAWGSFSDLYGRRMVYLISMVLFVLSSVGCALATNIEVLVVMRIIQGMGSSSCMVVGVGTISDVFPREDRGSAMGIFLVGPLIGPIIGPVLGGYLNQYLGWRSIFWFLSSFGLLVLIGIAVFLPETLKDRVPFPIAVTTNPIRLQKTGRLPNPLRPLVYLRHLNVSLIVLYACFIFGSYYLISSTQARSLVEVYALTPSMIGLSYIPLGVGNMVGSLVGGRVSDYILRRETLKLGGLNPRPEVRLYGVFVGSLVIPLGLLLTGWSLERHLPLPVTLLGQFMVGMGMTNVFSGTSTYLMDLFPRFVSSITACNLCLRTIAAAIVTTTNSLLFKSLGYGWAYSLFGFLQIPGVMILLFLIFRRSSASSVSP